MTRILVLGATGYIGGRLVPQLINKGYQVRCLVRDRRKIENRNWPGIEIHEGDVLNINTLDGAFDDIDIVYYFIHSMASSSGKFENLDRRAAQNVVEAAGKARVKRIIYLGGLGRRDIKQSPHLRSRHEVGDILRSGNPAVTEFRAAVIVGSGSLSFEMIHHLVNRLPMMICPKWVNIKTQPLAVDDVLKYLIACLELSETEDKIIDIGGPDIISYREMMLKVADALGLKRLLLQVPVLTPRLSSYWVNLMTPIPIHIARSLIDSLRYETIRENDLADTLFKIEPVGFDAAVHQALTAVRRQIVETRWTGAAETAFIGEIDSTHLLIDTRTEHAAVPAERLFSIVSSIGGDTGWYYANWLWKLRGLIDKMIGGVGLRRGRRHPINTGIGEVLDFWRVEDFKAGRKIRLKAEMKLWGQAWLEFEVVPANNKHSKLIQTASYYPRGIMGLIYWYCTYPLHIIIFRGMAKAICRQAGRIRKTFHS